MLKNKKGIASIIIIAAIAIGIITAVGFLEKEGIGLGSLTASIGGYDIVWKQNWGHICCVQEFDYDIIGPPRYIDDVDTFKCDDYTNECKIIIELARDASFYKSAYGKYEICNLDGKNCVSEDYSATKKGIIKEFNIDVGKQIKFFPKNWQTTMEDSTIVTKKAKTFYIKGQENGKIYRTKSCVLSSDLKRTTLSDGLNELSKTGANSCQNYMTDFIQAATKTYNYDGQEVICQARQVYSIDYQKFKDGTTRKIQGSKIATVDCCPQEANCGDNFKFKENNKRVCTYDSECSNGGDPVAVDATHYVKYSCVNGVCEKSDKTFVECTLTAECIRKYGAGSVCDLSPSNWGKCVKQDKPFYCGDGICQELNGENKQTCPDDCELKCSEDQILVTKTSKKYIFFGEETVKKECKMKGTDWLKYLFYILLFVVGIFAFRFIWPIIWAGILTIKQIFGKFVG